MDTPILNEHNKEEYPPMHTAEHILNGTMVKMHGCRRAQNAHIERRKSKCDYDLPAALSPEQVAAVEARVNEVIAAHLPVKMEYITRDEARGRFDMERLPEDASATLRVVRVGDYDECLCVGTHVANTAEIGHFRISSTRYDAGRFRIVFRLDPPRRRPPSNNSLLIGTIKH